MVSELMVNAVTVNEVVVSAVMVSAGMMSTDNGERMEHCAEGMTGECREYVGINVT